ncbi:response regulator [Natronospirillum operosum]|uniref:Response regulator n=1 Tax=Natronospirillum operosum TaxID=2759953 RepID=A0A4Z0WFN7_9GAMM|nr:response regulator [Natronospirillum operosum]TGG93300.1 response regulator [Natronospirillum operosum]
MKKVMIVDDSPTILMSVSGVLERHNLEPATAKDAEEAVSLLEAGLKPDLIISDLNMPGMNGIEFVKKVRGMTGLRFTPVLMLTTESQQAKRDEARQAGATGWLVKPVQGEQLMQVIRKVLPGV